MKIRKLESINAFVAGDLEDTPGLGVDIDMDVAESMRVDPTGFSPQLSREDGSFTNW